jgi:hypothetical protein
MDHTDRRASTRTLMASAAAVAVTFALFRINIGLGLFTAAWAFFRVALVPIWLEDRVVHAETEPLPEVVALWTVLSTAWILVMMIGAFACYSFAVVLTLESLR